MAEAKRAEISTLTFEAALEELEQVVRQLESGEVPLEASITLYARGADLRRHCEEKLRVAEARVEEITRGPDGAVATRPADIPLTAAAMSFSTRDETEAFRARLAATADQVEAALDALLPEDGLQLRAAMRHALLGGKRLRAFLVLESAALFRVPAGQAMRAAMAVECLHAYSLVHDDLPSMDDDDLRRGRPTVHVKWDEATAVLAGDALQALAFELLSSPQGGIDPRIQMRLVARLAQASGAAGMVAGQALDLAAETAPVPLDLEAITALQALKTGALIVWSAEAGALLGRSDPTPLGRFAADLGLAFQIRDDILDVEGDAEAAGKRLRKDAGRGKATFVTLLGLEGARDRAAALARSAAAALVPYGPAARTLQLAAEFAVARET